jgi:hypothetical protein
MAGLSSISLICQDAASPRYVFTRLDTLTRAVFHPDDDALLAYLDEDGQVRGGAKLPFLSVMHACARPGVVC